MVINRGANDLLGYSHFIFEELLANPFDVLLGILTYLNLPVDYGRIDCVLKNIEGTFRRNHTSILENEMKNTSSNSKRKMKKEAAEKSIRSGALIDIRFDTDIVQIQNSIERVNSLLNQHQLPIYLNYGPQ